MALKRRKYFNIAVAVISGTVIVTAVVLSLSFFERGGERFIAAGVSASNVRIEYAETPLPSIVLLDKDGKVKSAGANNFWFLAERVYVQDGVIKVKGDAPSIFTDRLEIIYRENADVRTTIVVEKVYIPLERLELSTADGRNKCPTGGRVAIIPIFYPNSAGDKGLDYEIISGKDIARINGNGVLSVNDGVATGTEIQIRATAYHRDIPNGEEDEPDTAEITIKVSPKVLETSIALLQSISDGGYYLVSEWLYTSDYDGWQDIEFNFRELYAQGYEFVAFAWTTAGINPRNKGGSAEPELKLELGNGEQAVKIVYHNQDAGWGVEWGRHDIVFTKSLANILPFNQIRCAFRDNGEDEDWLVDWSGVRITVF
jgi:hypothetical protein